MMSGHDRPASRLRPGDLMARLGGGDAELLRQFPHERAKFIQMAGVLLTTSGIAVISMTFALHDTLRERLPVAVVFGFIWGIIIFNLDRFLVLSMGSIRNKLRLLAIFVPRFLMAVVLAAVISTPLVLRIFASDIKKQLFVIQQQESARQAKLVANSSESREAKTIAAQIKSDKSILAGKLPVTVTNPALQQAQAMVSNLTPRVQAAQQAEINARAVWQCELYGVGPHCDNNSGIPGPGPIAAAKEQLYEAALRHFNQLNRELNSANTTMQRAQHAANHAAIKDLAQYKAQAKAKLPALESEYSKLETYLRDTIAAGTAADNNDVGILARLQALSAASAHNTSLNGARLAVLALFFLIEILPVTVKFLLNLGPLTAYEDALGSRDAEKTDKMNLERAERRRLDEDESQARLTEAAGHRSVELGKLKAHVQVEEHMRSREVDLGKHANDYVAGEMKSILDVALRNWSHEVQAMLASGAAPGGATGPAGATGPGGGTVAASNGSAHPGPIGGTTGLPSGSKL
ncbi:MAG TPA: DUF4407 domain-containing protein [Streptosporangiaceae bacterium]|nr:DUF4407 domain-containing protein [Streptosporangiaceae bacterium]